jgi:hypothetical protein
MTGRPLASFVPISPDDDVPIQDADPARALHRAAWIHVSQPLPTGGWGEGDGRAGF